MLEAAKAEKGGIVLPDARNVFSTWDPNYHLSVNKGEILTIMSQPLHFYGPFPKSAQPDKGADQVFDYSRMTGRYFKPDDRVCVIIDNYDYSSIRNEHDIGFIDLPECHRNADLLE